VIANALLNTVQVVDLGERRLAQTIELGGPREPSLARLGEEIFYDAKRSTDQWYSCHSCHFEGGANAGTMDTNNDGSTGTYKTVLSLRNVTKTAPWFWHGWQQDLSDAVRKSLTDSMLGPSPNDEEVQSLLAFLGQLPPAINPNRLADGQLTPAAERGMAIFESSEAACASCHSGPYFTDGKVHDVGLNSDYDFYQGYNTPSLLGTFDRVRYLHNGRATTLEEVLTEYHSPATVSGTRELTKSELADLVAYLQSL
jgi:cytochrome c peroxidase